jgi:hypothetical protein
MSKYADYDYRDGTEADTHLKSFPLAHTSPSRQLAIDTPTPANLRYTTRIALKDGAASKLVQQREKRKLCAADCRRGTMSSGVGSVRRGRTSILTETIQIDYTQRSVEEPSRRADFA